MLKKLLVIFSVLMLSLAMMGGASASSTDDHLGETMPDFSVQTADGGTFTLSEALKEKDAVLVNFCASWCPWCKVEFPFMQEAYEKYGDRAAIVALSVEPTDSLELLDWFLSSSGGTFPIGRDEGQALSAAMNTVGYPTTVVVDRFGRIAYVEAGAMLDTVKFEHLFDILLADDYTETRLLTEKDIAEANRYSFICIDQYLNPVEGATLSYCTDTLCQIITTNHLGAAVFTGDEEQYHVKVLHLPDGYTGDIGGETIMGRGDTLRVLQVTKEE